MIMRKIVYCINFLLMWPVWACAVAPNTVVATIPVGVNPDGMAITPDNSLIYVANNNNYEITGQDSISVINAATNMVIDTIYDAAFNQIYRMAINKEGTKLYATNSNALTISIIDIPSNIVAALITGFDGPSGMAITPDGLFAYVNNYGAPGGVGSGNATTVSVVNLISNTIVATINVGLAPAALAMTPDGAYVYVVNYVDGNPGTGTVSVIRTADNTVVQTIAAGLSGPFAIAITPNGRYAYITNFGSNNFEPIGTTVTVLDLSTNTVSATIDLALMPSGVGITPDGRFAYVTNYNTLYAGSMFTDLTPGDGIVNIIDIATNTVIPPNILVGQAPDGVAISSNGEYAYITNYISNTVSVIALQSFQITAQGCKMQNRYLTQIDLINKITWQATGLSLPVRYDIYRDEDLTVLAGTVLATEPFVFLDHNRQPNVHYTYYIVGTNSVGTTSIPVAVTVTQAC